MGFGWAWAVGALAASAPGQEPAWPAVVRSIEITRSFDGGSQRAMFWAPETREARPLLVALHTWSSGYDQRASAPWAREAMARGWVFIHPDFRGANDGPHAGGSDAAIEDVRDAVREARRLSNVDASRIYLAGYSGGGHAALLVAGRTRGLFAAVSVWSPIVDLGAWRSEARARGLTRYVNDIDAICGGEPALGSGAQEECQRRSPLASLSGLRGVALDLNSGIRDGHAPRVESGTVPISHVVKAFNALARARDRVGGPLLERLMREAAVPTPHAFFGIDPEYGAKRVLFRVASGAVRLTLFDGDHEVIHAAAATWLATHRRSPR
jgi:poly(3-hydroxybutyrate) depolymerase